MRTKLHQIDPSGASNGQVPVWNGTEWTPGTGGLSPDAGRSPWLAPYGVRLRGVNIDAKVYSPDTAPWGKMFAEWNTIWDTYIKPQIDNTASIGANSVRMMGAAPSVLAGYCTEAQYLDGYERLVDYCATQGLWVYGVLSASQEWFSQTVANVMPVMVAQAQMLNSKPNVIGIDVCQEIGLTADFLGLGLTTRQSADLLVPPIRDVTSLPLTCSAVAANTSASHFASTTVTDYDDLFDFYDYHPYYDGMTVADVAPAASAAATSGQVLLLGEYGATTTAYQRYEAVAAVTAGTTNVVGSLCWAAADRLGGPGDFGLFTQTFTPRASLIAAFQTIPDHAHSKHTGHHVYDEGIRLPDRSRLNIVGAGATATDDSANDTTTVTIPGLTVQDEGSTVATGVVQLDFQGAGVTVTTGTGELIVTIPTGTGEILMQDGVTAPPVPIETEAQDDWLYQD